MSEYLLLFMDVSMIQEPALFNIVYFVMIHCLYFF